MLMRICQKVDDERKVALINELSNLNIEIENEKDLNIVCKCKSKDVIILSAHYDVFPNSYGYNDNGMSLITILNIINKLNDNVQVVFTGLEEWGGKGAVHYLRNTNKNIIGCINLDVCGIGDYIYCDNYSYKINPIDCKIGKMPFCDGNVFSEKIPTITFSTSYKDMDFRDGIMEILSTIHNNEKDNNIDVINFDLVKIVSDKVLETIKLFEK